MRCPARVPVTGPRLRSSRSWCETAVRRAFGYSETLRLSPIPPIPEHAEGLEWWGSDRFDPHHFDLAATDRALEHLAWISLSAARA